MFVQIMVRSVYFHLLTKKIGELMSSAAGSFVDLQLLFGVCTKNIYSKLSCSLNRSSSRVAYSLCFIGDRSTTNGNHADVGEE